MKIQSKHILELSKEDGSRFTLDYDDQKLLFQHLKVLFEPLEVPSKMIYEPKGLRLSTLNPPTCANSISIPNSTSILNEPYIASYKTIHGVDIPSYRPYNEPKETPSPDVCYTTVNKSNLILED